MKVWDAKYIPRKGRRTALVSLEEWRPGLWKVRVNARPHRYATYAAAKRAFDRIKEPGL